jgi:4-amino-4-deoxy-L-arabinose transferase-like glycosyltransferase
MEVGSALRPAGAARADAVGGPSDDDSPRARRPDEVWLILAIGCIVAVGIGLRFFTQSNLWADEVLSVNIARLPMADLQDALRQDGAPPLYYALLHYWMRVFGTDDAPVRAMSGVFGVATIVPVWFAGRRLDLRRVSAGLAPEGSRTVAWAAVLVLATSPYAIRYSTEARMYALVMLLVALGYLAVHRALERPSWARLLCVTVLVALLLYTHYWAFALLAVVIGWLALVAWRGWSEMRRPALAVIAAIVVGALAFIPWLPTFRFQMAHTGTPWGNPVSPVASPAAAFKSFGGNLHVVGWMLLLMAILAVFARAVDSHHFEVDLRTRPGVRVEAGLGLLTLAVGLAAARVSDTTFEGRYAAVMFPLFLLAAAFGVTVFASRPVRYCVLAILVIGGFWGGGSNAFRNRTQAYQVANAIRDGGHPGDLVVYCPDAIGTDVGRLLRDDVRQVSFPSFAPPGRIDWTDYRERVAATDPVAFARAVVDRAGPDHTIWFVSISDSPIVAEKCGGIGDALSLLRPGRVRLFEPDPYFFEHQGLVKYPPNPPAG